MKMYILAFSAFVAVAGTASAANVDYIDCNFSKRSVYNEQDFSHYCGNQNRNVDAQQDAGRQYNGGSPSYGNSNNNY
jgi:hypothetical protein